jgi:hypothetical protein
MRPTGLLRQIAAGASSTQRKLPLPTLFQPDSVPRLKPPKADFLPSLINCPTTLPPVFLSPKQIDKTAWFAVARQLYHKAKSYYQFYKTGIKQATSNRKIRKFLKSELIRSVRNIQIPGSANIVMSRSEFQMCIRTRRDWRKMPCMCPWVDGVDSSVWRRCHDLWGVYTDCYINPGVVFFTGDLYYECSIG